MSAMVVVWGELGYMPEEGQMSGHLLLLLLLLQGNDQTVTVTGPAGHRAGPRRTGPGQAGTGRAGVGRARQGGDVALMAMLRRHDQRISSKHIDRTRRMPAVRRLSACFG